MRELNIRWLGKLPYGEAYILQKGLHAATSQESSPFDYLLLLEHNNVVTIGRSGDINNLLVSKNILNENNIEFFETDRGGDITCLLYTSPSPRDKHRSRMPSSA